MRRTGNYILPISPNRIMMKPRINRIVKGVSVAGPLAAPLPIKASITISTPKKRSWAGVSRIFKMSESCKSNLFILV